MNQDPAPNCPAARTRNFMPPGPPWWMDPTPDRPWRACSHCGSTHPLDWAAMTCFPGTTVLHRLREGLPIAFLVKGVPDLRTPKDVTTPQEHPVEDATLEAGLNIQHLLDLAPKGPKDPDTFTPAAAQIHARTGWVIALTGTFEEPALEFSRQVQITRLETGPAS